MDLRLEPAQLLGVGEDDLADPRPVYFAGRGHVGAPALDQPAPQRFAVEQLVDDAVAGDRRGAESLERRQGLGLAGGDPPGEPDRQRRHRRR